MFAQFSPKIVNHLKMSLYAGPRLWEQPISLPFQLFPSDSQQEKQNIFNQQQFCSQGNLCSSQGFSPNCYQQSFSQQNKQKVEELSQMFGRTSLKNN